MCHIHMVTNHLFLGYPFLGQTQLGRNGHVTSGVSIAPHGGVEHLEIPELPKRSERVMMFILSICIHTCTYFILLYHIISYYIIIFYYIILCYIIYIILYYFMLHYIILYHIILYYVVLYCIILYTFMNVYIIVSPRAFATKKQIPLALVMAMTDGGKHPKRVPTYIMRYKPYINHI
jgi:ABC-type multidrug transport system permease subunit